MPKPQTIRAAVVQAAARLGLSPYKVGLLTAEVGVGKPTTPDGMKDYFEGRSSLGSDRLDAVFAVLGLRVSQ